MVRLKHRYLLLNILYPDAETPTKPSTDAELPHVISFRRPSSDKLNAQLLARIIRDGVAELFGDYGSGMIAASLVGESTRSTAFRTKMSIKRQVLIRSSQISFPCHQYSNRPGITRALSTRLGSPEFRHSSTKTDRSELRYPGRQGIWNYSQGGRGGYQKSQSRDYTSHC